MAQKYTVELIAKTDKAINEIEDLKNEIKGLQSQVSEGNKNTANGLDTIGTAAKKTNRVLVSVGNTLKAIGIGLLLASLEKLREVFASNQKVIDFFNITMETLTIAFNDLFNFLNANVGTVIGYFKSLFTDPLGAIQDMSAAIEKYLIRSFVNFIELIEVSGLAISKFFKGDWAGAIGLASVAGSKFVDVVTGVDDSMVKAGEAVSNIVEGIKGYVKGTIDAATSTIELNKAAATAEIQLQGLLEKYDRQAEKLRQVRDEERNTIDERIKANNDLKAVLDEQEAAMLRQVDTIIAAAQAQYNKNANQENYIALLEATQEREAVLAQIEGFRSEQLSNDLALNRESLELTQSQTDASAERAISEQQFLAEQIQGEYLRLEALKSAAEQEAIIEEERLTNKRNQYKAGTQAFVDANN